jgi:hypothetical protein
VGETYGVLASARRSSIRIVREKRALALDANSCVDANQIPRIGWDFDVTAGNSSLAPVIRARVVHALRSIGLQVHYLLPNVFWNFNFQMLHASSSFIHIGIYVVYLKYTLSRSKFSLQRRLRVRTIQYNTTANIWDLYDFVDPDVVLTILVHQVQPFFCMQFCYTSLW